MHCDRLCLVMRDPLLFASFRLSGRDAIICFNEVGPASRASIKREMSGGSGRVCTAGCVGVRGGGV